MANPNFWSCSEEHRKNTIEEMKKNKQIIDPFFSLNHSLEDMSILLDLASAEKDEDSIREIAKDLPNFSQELQSFVLKTTFTNPDDSHNAFLSIQAGAGGTDACDWAEMLLRMYMRYANHKKFSVEILDYQAEEEGGIKSATIHIKGEWAYGYLKAERGVHRLVRISPYDSSGRRHTSFAAVDTLPEYEEEAEIEIQEKDLRFDFYRSSGAGGQHVNVTDSAVRITHLPTGIVVCCQNERSQHKNKAYGMKILRSRLLQKKKQEHNETMAQYYENKGQVSWSNQIRSYFLHPYTLIKDHRTNFESGNAQAVLDGEIDNFISAYIVNSTSSKKSNS